MIYLKVNRADKNILSEGNIMKLGKLEEANVRDLWKHEQYDFSTWLAKDENIEELGNNIGLNLSDVNEEVYAGSYRYDSGKREIVLCKET